MVDRAEIYRAQIAIIADHNAICGAHVVASTTLRHLTTDIPCVFHVLFNNWGDTEKKLFEATVKRARADCDVRFHTTHWSLFDSFRPALGTRANYALFTFPNQLSGRVLFLDCDVIVKLDVSPLFEIDLDECIAAAVSWENLSASHDKIIFNSLGIPLSSPHFNCGVLLIDCDKWQLSHITDQAFKLRARFNNVLVGGNQPVLNAVLYGRIRPLERRYNTLVHPHRILKPEHIREERVWHMIGRPKPWDPFGPTLHALGGLYMQELSRTALVGSHMHRGLLADIRTILRHLPKYLRCVRARLKSRFKFF